MIFTVIDLYDVFRTDLFPCTPCNPCTRCNPCTQCNPCTKCRGQKRREMFSTCPGDYLSKDGFYL